MGRKLPKEAGGLGEKLFAHSLQTWRTAAWAGGSGETCMPASEIRIKISLFLWSSLQTFKTYLGDLLMDLLKQFTS